MSALDDCLDRWIDARQPEARAELELLRETFDMALDHCHCRMSAPNPSRLFPDAKGYCHECRKVMPHAPESACVVARILRTDPERARKMGLGWAL